MLQIFSETRSKIHYMSDDKKKVYTFDVPSSTSLQEAYDILAKMSVIIYKKIEEEKKAFDKKKEEKCCKADSKKNECKAALHEKKEAKKI